MEDPIRNVPSRTSKFSQKLSSLKAIITRRTKDDSAVVNTNNPYLAQSRRDSKPYMSQPILVLSQPTPSDIDADDISDQSDQSSPINRFPVPARKVSAQSTVSNSGFPAIIIPQPTSNGAGTANLYPSLILPPIIKTSRQSIPNSLRPGVVRALPKPPLPKKVSEEFISNSLKPGSVRGLVKPPSIPSKVKPIKSPSTSPSNPLPPIPLSSSSSNCQGDTLGPNANDQVATLTANVNNPYMSTKPVLTTYSSTPTLPSNSSSVIDGIGSSDFLPTLPVLEESPSSVNDVPKRERVHPKLTVNTTLDINVSNASTPLNTTSSQRPNFTPIQPRRTVSTGTPRLSLPPANYRFSLNLIDGYTARMSPSVILRPPPLPLFNLPVLPRSTTTQSMGTSSSRSRRAGLMSMPALPRQGSSRGAAGHEEIDDVQEDEEVDDGDGLDDDDHTSLNSVSLEDEVDAPPSGCSTTSEMFPSNHSHLRSRSPSTSSYETTRGNPSTKTARTEPSASSYATARAEPSISSYETAPTRPSTPPNEGLGYFGDLSRPLDKRFSRSPFLPPVDMSRIDLSFLDSSPLDINKGKGKSKDLTEDAGRTPIATIKPNRNANNNTFTPTFGTMDIFIPEETVTDTWPPSPSIISPSQTPRPGHFNIPIPVPPRPIMPTRLTDNRLSVLSMNSITQFPGTYKRASRSLIDVYASEKKEKVEQMVREEEEGAEKERKKRIKSMRMSMRVAPVVEGAAPFDLLNGDEDGTLKASSPSALPKRASLAPHWVDDNDKRDTRDLIKASGETSSATTKQSKKTDNRISMAPAYDTIIPLRRRLSMPTFNSTSTPPPPYPDLFPGANANTYGVKLTQIQPRDDEGREKLPAYSNSIYLKAIMPRKLEFSKPGVQAKDRKWKRVLCVLEGTSFKVYKPPGVSAIEGWWENKVGVGDMAVQITTTSSFNSGAGGVVNATRQNKGDVERERERAREVSMRSSQFNNAISSNQRQGPSPTTSGSPYLSNSGGATKSALNLAVHLLKPSSRGHGRTISDVGRPSNTPSVGRSPRPSLNMPRNGRSTPTLTIGSMTTATSASVSSSRSQSPVFASPSSLATTPMASSSSHRSTDSTSSIGGGSTTSWMHTNNDNFTGVTSSSSSSKGRKKVEESDLEAHPNSLIKAYTMQQAECGLGSDYTKRKHVIRVRLEGEQFLLQAKDVDSVIAWIEGLQCATNVAMDLDERVMPRGPLFPRRRRRARPTNTAGVQPAASIRAANTPVDAMQLARPLVF